MAPASFGYGWGSDSFTVRLCVRFIVRPLRNIKESSLNEIPKPTDTGSAGTQQAGIGVLVVSEKSPLNGLPITNRVEGLAAAHPRSMGGEVAANLIAGSFSQLSHDFQTTRQELKDTRGELKGVVGELLEVKIRAAVLLERANASERDRNLKNLGITTGTILIGLGIELYRNSFEKFGYIVGGLGLLLLVLGWFPQKGAEK